jgi:hypothetical protein
MFLKEKFAFLCPGTGKHRAIGSIGIYNETVTCIGQEKQYK